MAFDFPSFGQGQQPDQDIFAQQEALARRQKLTDALTAAGQQAPLVGGQGGLQALLKVIGAAVAAHKQKGLEKEASSLRGDYQSQLSNAMTGYLDKYQGRPGETMTDDQAAMLMHQDQAPQLAEPVKPDPRAAVVQAMTSQFPELRQVGLMGMQGLNKGGLTPKDLLGVGGADLQSRIAAAMTGDPSTLRPEAKKPIVVNGQLVDPDTRQPVGDFRTTYEAPFTGPNGTLFQKDSTGKVDSVDKAPKVNVQNSSTTLVKGQKAGMEAWSREAADVVKSMAQEARQAVKTLSSMNQMEGLIKGGTYAGPLADAAVFLNGLAKQFGVKVDEAKLNNSATFASEATRMWVSLMQAAGGARGLVKEESDRLIASLPTLSQTPEGRRQIMSIIGQGAKQTIKDAQTASKEYGEALRTEDPSKFTFGLSQTMLPNTTPNGPAPGSVSPPGGPPPSVMTLDQYLKR